MADFRTSALLMCIAVVGCCYARSIAEPSEDPLAKQIKNIPADELSDFVVYHLAMGLNYTIQGSGTNGHKGNVTLFPGSSTMSDDLIDKFEKMHIPRSSSVKLVDWTREKFNFSDSQFVELMLYKRVCSASGCSDGIDIGGTCCPW